MADVDGLYQIVRKNKKLHVVLKKDLSTANKNRYQERLLSEIQSPDIEKIGIDFGSTTYMDKSGLGVLVTLQRAAEESGKRLYLLKPPSSVKKLLRQNDLARHFIIIE